ncbi:ATPase P [Fontimonas sp. SYSU GA230001]|uniref:HAD family hydrolase n=1 Tax=Fontimonas sp. SYSU GA230001 TaxID=3142450 RepID=UPI0032B3EF95
MSAAGGIRVQIPERGVREFTDLVCDFNGTLALDGALLPGVAERLHQLADRLRITVLTSDTYGTARAALAELPVAVETVRSGRDKARWLSGKTGVVAIGNGQNDIAMMWLADLTVAVIGPEGVAPDLLRHAHLAVRDITDALDLLLHPQRLAATLRL